MRWNINYLDAVEKWLDSLASEQLSFLAKEMRLLELSGNELRLPHSRSLGGGLMELRERRFGLRIYYCFQEGHTVLLLWGGDKSTQLKDIKKAKTLLKQCRR